jgi:surface antigen
MKEITTLKKSLEGQQKQVTQILADQRSQRVQLSANQSEVNQLLATAQQNAAAADQQVKDKNSEISKLKAQQAAVLAARFSGSRVIPGGTCGGGYPGKWCNVPKDSTVDSWGMYNRECVSYTAFKVWSSGRNMPYWGGRGNANQWDDNARAAGISVNGSPRVGDVAQTDAGPYGHVAYVEAVMGNSVRISQYNFSNNGEYSEMVVPVNSYNYIHF